MKEIPLTQGKVTIVDDDEFDKLIKHKWHSTKHKVKNKSISYVSRMDRGNKKPMIYMHRLILGVEDGEVDHINGDTLDNRKDNLRAVTRSQNQMNKGKTESPCSSRFKGVYWSHQSSSWAVQIKTGGVVRSMSGIESEEIAARIYDLLAIDRFKEYARPNFEDSRKIMEHTS